MKPYRIGVMLGAVALLLAMAPRVRADGIDNFTFTESLGGGNTLVVTWSLPSSPTQTTLTPGYGYGFTGVNLTYTLNGVVETTTSNTDVGFFFSGASLNSGGAYGGLEIVNDSSCCGVIYAASTSDPGVQLFTGDPTFTLGTYTLTDVAFGNAYPATLVISTPEPSTLLLLLAGLLSSVVVLGLKRTAA